MWRAHRLYTWSTVWALGTCLGTCLALLGAATATLFQAGGFRDANELVWIRSSMLSQKLNPDLVRSIHRHSALLDHFAAYTIGFPMALETADNRYIWAKLSLVSGDPFSLLGIDPFFGRGLQDRDIEMGSEPVMLMSHQFWQSTFGGNPDVVGEVFTAHGHAVRLIGVLPPGFEGPSTTESFDLYIPVVHYAAFVTPYFERNINWHSLTGITRVPEGKDLAPLHDKLEAFFSAYVDGHPNKVEIHPRLYRGWRDTLHQRIELAKLYMLVGSITLALLVIAVCNTLTFMALKTAWRREEILIRSALGGTRRQLLRQFFGEAVSLVLVAWVIALFFSAFLMQIMKVYLPDLLPAKTNLIPDQWVLSGSLLSLVVLVLLLTLMPLFSVRMEKLGDLTRGVRSASRKLPLLPILAGAQVAVTTLLLVFTFLLIRSAWETASLEPGYRTKGLFTFNFSIRHLEDEIGDYSDFRVELEQAIEELPEVEDAALGQLNFLEPMGTINFLYMEESLSDTKYESKLARSYLIGPGFLELMEIPLLQGRDFAVTDLVGADRVAIVNKAFLEAHFPGEDPLKVRFKLGFDDEPVLNVVGVIPNFAISPDILEYPVMISALNQIIYPGGSITISPRGPPELTRQAVLAFLDRQYPFLAIRDLQFSDKLIRESTADLRSGALIAGTAGTIASFLCLVGLVIIFSYSIFLQNHEYAIRSAMGALPRQIRQLAFIRFSLICLLGVAAGFILAWSLMPLSGDTLPLTRSRDPLTSLSAFGLVTLSCGILAYWIAGRVLRVDTFRELQSA